MLLLLLLLLLLLSLLLLLLSLLLLLLLLLLIREFLKKKFALLAYSVYFSHVLLFYFFRFLKYFFFVFPVFRSCTGTELPKQSVSNIAKCIAGICAKAEVMERVDIVKVCLLSVCIHYLYLCIYKCQINFFLIFFTVEEIILFFVLKNIISCIIIFFEYKTEQNIKIKWN